jgi:hypothetical protein
VVFVAVGAFRVGARKPASFEADDVVVTAERCEVCCVVREDGRGPAVGRCTDANEETVLDAARAGV